MLEKVMSQKLLHSRQYDILYKRCNLLLTIGIGEYIRYSRYPLYTDPLYTDPLYTDSSVLPPTRLFVRLRLQNNPDGGYLTC